MTELVRRPSGTVSPTRGTSPRLERTRSVVLVIGGPGDRSPHQVAPSLHDGGPGVPLSLGRAVAPSVGAARPFDDVAGAAYEMIGRSIRQSLAQDRRLPLVTVLDRAAIGTASVVELVAAESAGDLVVVVLEVPDHVRELASAPARLEEVMTRELERDRPPVAVRAGIDVLRTWLVKTGHAVLAVLGRTRDLTRVTS